MPDAQGFSASAWTAINAVGATLVEVGELAADPESSYFPSKGTLSHVEVELDNIVGAPASVTVFATWDSGGAFIALPSTVATLTTAFSGATEAGAVISADQIQYKQGAGATKRKFYVALRLNAGTADARVRVYWRR